ncbi:hypothetical protein NM208_g10069 [Fusarium decemcellulare]|uniref:Uncharacterized protein n=1 Tax=Fusarium decemcellulare TaxID=57161 RepID=A0ACC1RZ78_9HYPO|nr:hypothetical protein NM208_g10069 [Fusarium decemcellulare]
MPPIPLLQFSNNGLKQFWQDNCRISNKHPIPVLSYILSVISAGVDNGDPSTLLSGHVSVPGGRPDPAGGAYGEAKINRLGVFEQRLNFVHDVDRQALAEPDDPGPEDIILALGTLWQVLFR